MPRTISSTCMLKPIPALSPTQKVSSFKLLVLPDAGVEHKNFVWTGPARLSHADSLEFNLSLPITNLPVAFRRSDTHHQASCSQMLHSQRPPLRQPLCNPVCSRSSVITSTANGT